MKTVLASLLLIASTQAQAIERDVEIECNLTKTQSAEISKVRLLSFTDEIQLEHRNGQVETLKPVDARGGTFGTEVYSKDLVWNNGQVFAPTSSVGAVFVRYQCFLTPEIAFDRCISQGDREPARFAGVRLNLGGKAITLVGKNICSRVDRSPL